MRGGGRRLIGLLLLALGATASSPRAAAPAPRTLLATPAPAPVVAQLQGALERARQRFEARDRAGVLTAVSEQYRSSGMTKAAVREQLTTMFTLYQQIEARVRVDRVDMVEGAAWIYTTGEVNGRLPIVGWVSVLSWQGEPEVVRLEAAEWRLFGFQD